MLFRNNDTTQSPPSFTLPISLSGSGTAFVSVGGYLFMKEIPLNKKRIDAIKGYVALVDDDDFERAMQYSWCLNKNKNKNNFYARHSYRVNGITFHMSLHRFVMGFKRNDGKMVDHIDRNGLNCQKNNLRSSTSSQNNANKAARGTSKYLGVSWYRNRGKWVANIGKNKKKIFIGYFNDETKAAKAYDEKALEIHGEFANLNFLLLTKAKLKL